MIVANSFDLWQKDAFFSAAEEVQESADRMESIYKAWLRVKRERPIPEELDELCRELKTALGTAKWQLEEFENAVRLSYRHLGDDNTTTRHRQFISVIESQISHVETALRESFIAEGRQPFRWVNLDEEEQDDFAAFLSGTSQTIQSAKDECKVNKNEKDFNVNAACNGDRFGDEKTSNNVITINKDVKFRVEIKADGLSKTCDDVVPQADRSNLRKSWSTPTIGELKIVVADEDEQQNKLMHTVEGDPQGKGFKPCFWKHQCEEYPQAMRAVHVLNQFFGQIGCFRRQFHSTMQLRYRSPVHVILALMLIIFLIAFAALTWPRRHAHD